MIVREHIDDLAFKQGGDPYKKLALGKNRTDSDIFDIELIDNKQHGPIYKFTERDKNKDNFRMTYTYYLLSGELSRINSAMYISQNVLSNIHTLHKNNPSRIAIPNDMPAALRKAEENLLKYKQPGSKMRF